MPEPIEKYLVSIGWHWDGCNGVVSPTNDYRVDLDGDYGYDWELQRFSDADRDGVAVARWVRMDVEGDTIEELKGALSSLEGTHGKA